MSTRRAGDSIGNRYRILDTLGRGGMGTVHLVKDRLGGLVALKRLGTLAEPEEAASAAVVGIPEPRGVRVPRTGPQPSAAVSPDGPTRVSSAPVDVRGADVRGAEVHGALATTPRAPAKGASPVAALGSTLLDETIDSVRAPVLSARGPRAAESSILLRETDEPARDDMTELLRLTLAREFHLLASLRHPNIISVLDYGFDDDLSPYFTMELLSGAESIMRAAAGRSIDERLDLLGQMLQALAYLHRRGVIHRDLKPGNVMVVGGQVKVLDFGVSTARAHRPEKGGVIVGTLAYMAPEMLTGGGASEASDLYAVGTIAYELFAGRYPFRLDDLWRLRDDILNTVPDLSGIDPRLRPVVARLLDKRPEARPESVDEVFAEIASLTGRPLLVETAATRESFLQAAELVGRDAELAELSEMLTAAMTGRGGGALIGGESGVGKSRLLDEVRVRALVDGMVVLRGQAADVGSAGGGPYHVFREVLRGMALRTDIDDFEAGVLAAVVPDLPALLEREVPPSAEIDPEAAHRRLIGVVESLFARQVLPVLVILEDLQWAGSESLRLLGHLAGVTVSQPALFLGSYRDDERPDLPRELPQCHVLKLQRLTGEGIAALAASMLGDAGRRPEVVDRLRRETEGNPFFLVEVVRALAEDAGALSRVGIEPMPATLPAGGLHLIVRRRLNQVPRWARPLLDAAAVIGRRLDPALLRRLDPGVDVDAWIRTCANVAVLEVSDDAFRFAHDKLREGLLAALSPEGRRALHRRVAEAIEAEYGDAVEQTMALAHHYAVAGDEEKEARYSALAGEQALHGSDYRTAATFFERAIAVVSASEREAGGAPGLLERVRGPMLRPLALLRPEPVVAGSARFRLGLWEGRLSEVYGRMSDHPESIRHGQRALGHLGRPMPAGTPGLLAGLPVQAALRAVLAFAPEAFAEPTADERAVIREAARIHERLSEASFYTQESLPLLWSGISILNLSEPAGPSSDLARGYAMMAAVAGVVPLHSLAKAWIRRALSLVEESAGKPYDQAFVLQRVSAYRAWTGEWDAARAGFDRVIDIARTIGDQRSLGDALGCRLLATLFHGQLLRAAELAEECRTWARRAGDAQALGGTLILEAGLALRQGYPILALDICREVRPAVDAANVSHEIVRCQGVEALAHVRAKDPAAARRELDQAIGRLLATRPVAWWTFDGVAATADAAISLWAWSGSDTDRTRALSACRAARAYASVFPIGRPFAFLAGAAFARLDNNPASARRALQATITEAERLDMPYERARAFAELGRLARRDDPEREQLLGRAESILTDLGAPFEAAEAREEIVGGFEPALQPTR